MTNHSCLPLCPLCVLCAFVVHPRWRPSMPPPVSDHPTESALAAFALRQLAPDAATDVGRHLARCAACRAALDRLPRETLSGPPADTSPAVAPSAAGSPDDVPPELRDHPRYQVIQ